MRALIVMLLFAVACSRVQAQPVVVSGYNAEIVPGLNLVGLHLDYRDDHSISNLFKTMPEGTELYQTFGGGFTTNVFKEGKWERPNDTLALGEGVFILNPSTESFVHGFGGIIPQGFLTNLIPAGLSIQASMAPRGGKATEDLGLRLNAFDNLYLLEGDALKVFTFMPDGTWRPTEPVVRVSEAFLINAARATNWVMHIEL